MDRLHLPARNSKVLSQPGPASVISFELIGSTECRCEAYSISTFAHAPALALCRALIHASCNPDQALEIHRAGVFALRICSIGEAADLVVEDNQNGRPRFRLERPARRDAASPMQKNGRGGS
jgi:hypothetical protein